MIKKTNGKTIKHIQLSILWLKIVNNLCFYSCKIIHLNEKDLISEYAILRMRS